MRKLPLAILIPALLSGCASTDYVDSRVSASDDRIASLVREVEQLRQSGIANQSEQYQRLAGLSQGLSDQAASQERLATRLAASERRLGEQDDRLSGLATRLDRQAEILRASEALGRQALDTATKADAGVSELGKRVDGLAQGQAEARTSLDQLAARQRESEAGLAHALSQTSQAEVRGAQAAGRADAAFTEVQALNGRLAQLNSQLHMARAEPPATGAEAAPVTGLAVNTPTAMAPLSDPEARRLAQEALGLANAAMERQAALLARLEGLSAPPTVPARAEPQPADASLAQSQSREALERVRALSDRVDAWLQTQVTATPVAAVGTQAEAPRVTTVPAEIGERLSQGEQRLKHIEADVNRQGQRLTGVEGGVEQASAGAKQALERVAGLDESGRQLDLRLKHSETLLLGLREQVTDHHNRLQTQEAGLTQVSATAREALERALAAGQLAQGKFVHEVTLSEDKYHFGFGSAELTPASTAALDDLVQRLNALNANVYLEIQGHADTSGPAEANLALAQRRAQAVRDDLHLRGRVPLHRMSVIAIGEARPVADNATREGRRQNRRVVIEVLR